MDTAAPDKLPEVLLIEDNPGDVRLAREAFRECRMRCSVRVANDGSAALRYLRGDGCPAEAHRPALILLDLNLPGMDGREVLGQIKSDPGLRRIPVIVLTTSMSEEDISRCYDLHADGYVTKPVNMDEFVEIIGRIERLWLDTVKRASE